MNITQTGSFSKTLDYESRLNIEFESGPFNQNPARLELTDLFNIRADFDQPVRIQTRLFSQIPFLFRAGAACRSMKT